jgi:hypothetical protein
LTTNSYEDREPQINLNGHVAWQAIPEGYGYEPEIMFYDGNSTIRLTNNSYFDVSPRINEMKKKGVRSLELTNNMECAIKVIWQDL